MRGGRELNRCKRKGRHGFRFLRSREELTPDIVEGTGRRFLLPDNKRGSKDPSGRKPVESRNESRRRLARRQIYCRRRGKSINRRRSHVVEPLDEWFKLLLLELEDRVWRRGLENNQTQLRAVLFAYGSLVRFNHRRGIENGQIRWTMDT